ncbi:MAG: hypothetical protein FWB80_14075 [Defluviitaleaceae bacterium]|nr:hypothetical protein [Defluviitaleaceae bacterium]
MLNLFKPAWESKNPNTRIKGVYKTDNQEILMKLASTDPVLDIRMAALDKISHPHALAELIKNAMHVDVCFAAIEKINDHFILDEIPRNELDGNTRKAILDRLDVLKKKQHLEWLNTALNSKSDVSLWNCAINRIRDSLNSDELKLLEQASEINCKNNKHFMETYKTKVMDNHGTTDNYVSTWTETTYRCKFCGIIEEKTHLH